MTEQLNIKIEMVSPNAHLPAYGSDGAACFDLFAATVESVDRTADNLGFETITIGTGLKFDIPDGWGMRLYSRSGHAFKHGVRLANCTAIIDADFLGEVMVKLQADTDAGQRFLIALADDIFAGKKVAVCQAELCPVEYVTFEQVDKIEKETARGENGFGSTDKVFG